MDLQTFIRLEQIHKRYTGSWVLKDINLVLEHNRKYGVSGRNGSGKSTLIQIISGHLSCSRGTIDYQIDGKSIPRSDIYQYLSLAAPYIDLIEEYSVKEMIQYYGHFKRFMDGLSTDKIISKADMAQHQHKRIKQLSSGLGQRVKLAMAVLTDAPILILDEPTSYLDAPARQWFIDLFSEYSQGKLVIVASNDPEDLALCDEVIALR